MKFYACAGKVYVDWGQANLMPLSRLQCFIPLLTLATVLTLASGVAFYTLK
jgi:hypothetical protein